MRFTSKPVHTITASKRCYALSVLTAIPSAPTARSMPTLAESGSRSPVLLAAQHALVRRRHLLAEDVGVEAPAPRVVERGVAVQEAGERRSTSTCSPAAASAGARTSLLPPRPPRAPRRRCRTPRRRRRARRFACPSSAAKSMSSAEWNTFAPRFAGSNVANFGQRGAPLPSRPIASTTFRHERLLRRWTRDAPGLASSSEATSTPFSTGIADGLAHPQEVVRPIQAR